MTERCWPADLHVVQVGDLFGGYDDVAVADLVEPYLLAGRWTQLDGNWELAAIGGPAIGRAGRVADPTALARFRSWHSDGLVRYAGVRSATGTWAVVTHADVTAEWWSRHTPDVDTGPAWWRRSTGSRRSNFSASPCSNTSSTAASS